MVADFAGGSELFRALAQAGALPDVARLSDRDRDARLAGAERHGGDQAPSARCLSRRSTPPRRLPGDLRLGGRSRRRSGAGGRSRCATCAAGGAVSLGEAAGRSWEHGRYQGPYLRDELLDLGYMVETLETSHTWSRLDELYGAVGGAIEAALAEQGTPGIVFCHLSHAYRDGASLYFTFVSRAPGRRRARAVAGGQARRLRGDRRRAAGRSPTTTRSAATTLPTWSPRSASSVSRRCARSRSDSTRPGS